LFTAPVEAIVNPTNTRGVMGKGLAYEFRERYFGLENRYKQFCQNYFKRNARWPIGVGWASPVNPKTDSDKLHKWVICFPTKDNWRYPSKAEYIEARAP
jgi:O-acetyl-ADP-ribose deacetylase (regulator of RNase III)